MQWLSILVTFSMAVIFGVLARRSPQKKLGFCYELACIFASDYEWGNVSDGDCPEAIRAKRPHL